MMASKKPIGGLVDEPTVPEIDRMMQAPQSPNDKHGANYDNDATGWVRGYGKPYPHFDSGPSGNKFDGKRK